MRASVRTQLTSTSAMKRHHRASGTRVPSAQRARVCYRRGGGGSGAAGRSEWAVVSGEATARGDPGGVAAGRGVGATPTPPNNDASTPLPASSAAFPIRHAFDPGAGLWCMGQIAWSPCTHLHSRSCSPEPSQSAVGATAIVATWHRSHVTASRPTARRRRAMIPLTLVDALARCQILLDDAPQGVAGPHAESLVASLKARGRATGPGSPDRPANRLGLVEIRSARGSRR